MPKNTPNARFRQVLSEIWPPRVFGLKTHVGGHKRVASHDDASRSRDNASWSSDNGSWSRADGSQKSENFGRPYLTQNLSKSGV